jgi:hypothetical protein
MENSKGTVAKAVIWIGAGCLISVVCLIVGAISGIGWLLWPAKAPENVALHVNIPVQVDVGDEILTEVTVVNNSTQPFELLSINFSGEYLHGMVISSSTPAFESAIQRQPVGVVYQSYSFHQSIAPGESLTVTFTGEAIHAGDYAGEIHVCADADFICIHKILRIVVR